MKRLKLNLRRTMLTISHFEGLSHYEKTEAILKGAFLADRLTEQHYIKLYNVDNFYVEVLFDDRTHLITEFRAYAHPECVLPYLQELRMAM